MCSKAPPAACSCCRLKNPDLPCVNVGTPTKPCWLPMDNLYIAPGQRRLKLNEKQVCPFETPYNRLLTCTSLLCLWSKEGCKCRAALLTILSLLPGQTAEMIKTAAQKPEERKRYIDKCLNQYAELNTDPVVEAWRMKVDSNMTQARAFCTAPAMEWQDMWC